MNAPPKPTVFIVDDDPSFRNIAAMWVANDGLQVRAFDARRFVAAFDPAWRGCVLLDLESGVAAGLDVHRFLVERRSGLSVIAISAEVDSLASRTASWADAVDFLEKPIDETQLLAAVEGALVSRCDGTPWPANVQLVPAKPPRRIPYIGTAERRDDAHRPWLAVRGPRLRIVARRSAADAADLAGGPEKHRLRLGYSVRRGKVGE